MAEGRSSFLVLLFEALEIVDHTLVIFIDRSIRQPGGSLQR